MSVIRVAQNKNLCGAILSYSPLQVNFAYVNKTFLAAVRALMVKVGQEIMLDPLLGPRFIEVCEEAHLDPKNPASIAQCLGRLHLVQMKDLPDEQQIVTRQEYFGLYHAQRFLTIESSCVSYCAHSLNEIWDAIPGRPGIGNLNERVAWIRDPQNAPALAQIRELSLSTIPRDIGRFSQLKKLTVTGWIFPFPSTMRKLQQLQSLDLREATTYADLSIIKELPSINQISLPLSVFHIPDDVLAHYWSGWWLHLKVINQELSGNYFTAEQLLLLGRYSSWLSQIPFAFWLRQKLSLPYIPFVEFLRSWVFHSPEIFGMKILGALCLPLVFLFNVPIILYNLFLVKMVIPLVMCVRKTWQ